MILFELLYKKYHQSIMIFSFSLQSISLYPFIDGVYKIRNKE